MASRLLREFQSDGEATNRPFELIVWYLKRLEELCVPLNWTNDFNLYEAFRFLSLSHRIVPDVLEPS